MTRRSYVQLIRSDVQMFAAHGPRQYKRCRLYTLKSLALQCDDNQLPACCDVVRFLSAPMVIICSNYLIDKWVREKVVNGVEHGIAWAGQVFFLVRHRNFFLQIAVNYRSSNILYM